MINFMYALGIIILFLLCLPTLERWYFAIKVFSLKWYIRRIMRKIAKRHKGEPLEQEMFDLMRDIDESDLTN